MEYRIMSGRGFVRTSINGKPAKWTADIGDKFARLIKHAIDFKFITARDTHNIIDANYYTPRPYVDEYNRGSDEEGFTYTIKRGDGTYRVANSFLIPENEGQS